MFRGGFAQTFGAGKHLRKFSLPFNRIWVDEERRTVSGVKAAVVKINCSIVNVLHSTLATEHT